jgi:hypothetical protein
MQKIRTSNRRSSRSEAFISGFLDGLCAPLDLISGSLEKPLSTRWRATDPSNKRIWIHVGDHLNAGIKSFQAKTGAVVIETKPRIAFQVRSGLSSAKIAATKKGVA